MPEIQKRPYKSTVRNSKAEKTRARILYCAKSLFASDGFECVTLEKIAKTAEVSTPTVYSLFQSKLGILRALIDEALPLDQFQTLVEKSIEENSPEERLRFSAKIARQMYDAEKTLMAIFQGAALLAPEFKELEKEKESRRYTRQEVTIKAMIDEKSLVKELSETKARDILWAFTGRDLYRMLVIEQGWSSDQYEKWLAELLILNLVKNKIK